MASKNRRPPELTAIRIHVEGGSNKRDRRLEFRHGFGQFLIPLREMARKRGIRWDLVVCGTRESAFDDFKTALEEYPEAFNVLLVDSEGPVQSQPWDHLKNHDGWKKPAQVNENHCHFMAQAMEAWFIADLKALEQYYGPGFNSKSLPKGSDVEAVAKRSLKPSLRSASRRTAKGAYDEARHAPRILALLDATRVRPKARHCDRFFKTLTRLMNSSSR